jgi:nucleoside 2-deoxyribosyltransferase
MKVYITARFKGTENKQQIEALSKAVKDARMTAFCLVKDVENYKDFIADPKELWQRTYDEIGASDALLIDVSDNPTGGRMVEAGIAYALRKPVIVAKRRGTVHKGLFDGIAEIVIEYDDLKDLTTALKKFEHDRNFNVTDRSAMFIMFVLIGGVIGWVLSQYFIPLGIVGMVLYWVLVRRLFSPLRAFDRVVILIPLALVWLAGLFTFKAVSMALMIAWGIGFWVIVLYVLRKLKLSL